MLWLASIHPRLNVPKYPKNINMYQYMCSNVRSNMSTYNRTEYVRVPQGVGHTTDATTTVL